MDKSDFGDYVEENGSSPDIDKIVKARATRRLSQKKKIKY